MHAAQSTANDVAQIYGAYFSYVYAYRCHEEILVSIVSSHGVIFIKKELRTQVVCELRARCGLAAFAFQQ